MDALRGYINHQIFDVFMTGALRGLDISRSFENIAQHLQLGEEQKRSKIRWIHGFVFDAIPIQMLPKIVGGNELKLNKEEEL